MRPYGIRKEDGKYMQPVITQATGNQPSPLALLVATCSRIGDTFQEDTSIFTQKNLVIERGKDDITTLKSCVDTRPNPFICLDRNIPDLTQQQQQQLHNTITSCHTTPSILQQSSCVKVKTEESYDYNHNCETLHLCPNNNNNNNNITNIISETRMLENQARTSFTKSCNRDTLHTTTSCGHDSQTQPEQQQSDSFSFNTNSSCEHAMPGQVNLPTETSSCAFQDVQPVITQQSSCALDNVSLPGSALSHVPPITQSLHYSAVETYQQRQKQYQQQSWQASQQAAYQRSHSMPEEKTPCLQHENFSATTPQVQSGFPQNSPYNTRHYRHSASSLSHMTSTAEQQAYDRTHHSSVTTPDQYYHPNVNPNSPHSYHYPSNFAMDVKQEPYASQTPMHTNYPSAGPSIMQPPTQHQSAMSPHLNMSPVHNHPTGMNPVHNHPAGMTSSFCNVCNPQPGNAYMPDLMNGPPSMASSVEMQTQSLAEYQYQQQQMMYARDNRRPRRIACTCPNCRDGENKTVTTKDGKQRKLHVCHIPGCGKIYGKTSHLRAHLRWHAGERPFACNWLFCNKRFTRSDELQRHRRTHTGDKRFECNVCLKKFMRSDHLSKHMKTHQTQKQKAEKSEATTSAAVTLEKTNASTTDELKTKESKK